MNLLRHTAAVWLAPGMTADSAAMAVEGKQGKEGEEGEGELVQVCAGPSFPCLGYTPSSDLAVIQRACRTLPRTQR